MRPSEKKRMCEPACLPVFQCGSCGFVCAFCRHGSEEHYACLRSETGLSFFDFTRAFQKHPDKCRRNDRTSAGVCKAGGGPAPSPQVRRGNQVLIMLAVLLANTVFYKAKKRLLTRNDADADGLLSVTSIIRMDRNTEDHIPLFNIADCCKCFHYE